MPSRTVFQRIVLLALLSLLAVPTAAVAGVTVTTEGATVTATGDAERDELEAFDAIIGTGPASTLGVGVENPAGVVAIAPCVQQSATSAECPGDALDAALGGENDTFTGFDLFEATVTVRGGEGSDTLNGTYEGLFDGGPGDDTLRPEGYGDERYVGGDGTDTVQFLSSGSATVGAASNDGFGTKIDADVERIEGGSGFDDIVVGPNAGSGHTYSGGGGSDSISYAGAGGPVAVSLDGAANDGAGARTDNVAADFEQVVGGAGDDVLVGGDGPNELFGSSGNDRLAGDPGDGGAADTLSGGPGADTLEGRGGGDDLFGGSENDTLAGGSGGDQLDGGTGADGLGGGPDGDRVSYGDRSGGVTVSLGDGANDGSPGENDDVGGDVEQLSGSDGDDTLTGSDGDNELRGNGGSDRLDGRGGADKVYGDGGEDTVLGGAGNDELRGGPGDDALDGGAGEDSLIGQEREDGRDGIDVLELRDGERDTAACPSGITRVLADQFDLVSPSCVLVERTQIGGGQPGSPPPAASPSPLPPPLRIVRQRVRVDRRGYVRIKASCPPGPACSGVLQLVAKYRKRERAVGRTVFAVPAGRKRTIRVRLSKLGRRLVRSRRVLRVDVAIAANAPNAKGRKVVALRLRR